MEPQISAIQNRKFRLWLRKTWLLGVSSDLSVNCNCSVLSMVVSGWITFFSKVYRRRVGKVILSDICWGKKYPTYYLWHGLLHWNLIHSLIRTVGFEIFWCPGGNFVMFGIMLAPTLPQTAPLLNLKKIKERGFTRWRSTKLNTE
jgi:hypothetical protein